MYGGSRGEQDPKTLGPSQAFVEGRKKGILFDVGHGGGSFLWRVVVYEESDRRDLPLRGFSVIASRPPV